MRLRKRRMVQSHVGGKPLWTPLSENPKGGEIVLHTSTEARNQYVDVEYILLH